MERWMYNYLRSEDIKDRRKSIAEYLIDHPTLSIRKLSDEFCLSKSQVHRDLHDLKHDDDDLYVQCIHILHKHGPRRWY